MHTAINLALSAPYRLKALEVVRFGVVTAKSGRDNEASLIKIFNTKSQKSCIIAQFIEGGHITLKRAASIDSRDYNGCRV